MAITIAAEPTKAEENVEVNYNDATLIKKIKDQLGMIEAIRVTRWLTKASLLASKEFVENLK